MKRRRMYDGVTAFVGLPGSGKTYGLAEVGLRALDQGRPVFVNRGFDLAGAETFGSFDEFLEIPNGSVICWDELPLYVNARKWQEFPDGLLYRLTQIRKDGLELYYSTIDWRMVDINVRRITFWVWECRAISSRLVMRSKLPPEERRRQNERPRRSELRRIKPAVYSRYDTLGKVAVGSAAMRKRALDSESWGELTTGPAGGGPVAVEHERERVTVRIVKPSALREGQAQIEAGE